MIYIGLVLILISENINIREIVSKPLVMVYIVVNLNDDIDWELMVEGTMAKIAVIYT